MGAGYNGSRDILTMLNGFTVNEAEQADRSLKDHPSCHCSRGFLNDGVFLSASESSVSFSLTDAAIINH
jgi:hypothetical protein